MGIPIPNLVIYLDASTKQLQKNLTTNREVLDIHENESVFEKIEFVKQQIIEYCGWKVIKCDNESGMKSIESINCDITEMIDNYIINKNVIYN